MKEYDSDRYSDRIDQTLRALGSVIPGAGIEERIVARLARMDASSARPRYFRLPQLAFGMSAAAMASVLIVAGSVSHSKHILPVAPGLHLPAATQPGVGAASAAHITSQPVTSLPQDRPRSVRETVNGRAVISSHAKKPAGIAVPKTLSAQ
jgi:hypothetical protein